MLQNDELTAIVKAIMANSQCLIVGMAPDNVVRLWSQSLTDLTGWTEAEVVGRNLTELLIPPHNYRRMRGAFEDTKNGAQRMVNYLLKKNGEKTLVFGRSVPVERGDVVFLVLVTGFEMNRYKIAKNDLA